MSDLMKDYELKLTASQEQDGNDSGSEPQFLTITSSDCGGGPFYIIETQRWAFDDKEEFFNIINEFIENFKKIQNKE